MKLALIWTTPVDTDPNLYLREYIAEALNFYFEVEEFDSNFQIYTSVLPKFDAILMCGTLLAMQLQVVNTITAKKSIPMYFWNFEDPYDHDTFHFWYRKFDHIFTTEIKAIPYYENASSSYLPLASPGKQKLNPEYPNGNPLITLVGSDYDRRREITDYLAETQPKNFDFLRIGSETTRYRSIKSVGRLPNTKISEIDLKSFVTLIIGRDFDFYNEILSVPAGSPGPRFFEALNSGVTILYDPYTIDLDPHPDLKKYAVPFYSRSQIWPIISDTLENLSPSFRKEQIEFSNGYHTYRNRAEKIFLRLMGKD